jgi:hypothetical protein
MEGCGAVEPPVLAIFLWRVGVVARPLDNREDMPLEFNDITTQPGHRSTDEERCN